MSHIDKNIPLTSMYNRAKFHPTTPNIMAQVKEHTNRHTNRQINRQTNRQINRQTNRQTDKQTNKRSTL